MKTLTTGEFLKAVGTTEARLTGIVHRYRKLELGGTSGKPRAWSLREIVTWRAFDLLSKTMPDPRLAVEPAKNIAAWAAEHDDIDFLAVDPATGWFFPMRSANDLGSALIEYADDHADADEDLLANDDNVLDDSAREEAPRRATALLLLNIAPDRALFVGSDSVGKRRRALA